ncbi:nucleoside hydrolase [Algoriphagus namhaensis]|uniref:Nucleoside hydrolase n=1 Tax=Algoriphagus namhaensis TaxID=915353 RepID=A0ABV8AVE5_9BACT
MTLPYHLVIFFLSFFLADGFKEREGAPLIIDADTANEVDDLFALARALNDPSIHLVAITSAQFHTSPLASDSTVWESQLINEELVKLTGRSDVALPVGANFPLESIEKPRISEASTFIVNQAKSLKKQEKLDVIILGSCTNVASAILQAPEIIPLLRVHYLGFWHNPETNTYNKKEFNSGNDTLAVNLLLNTEGLELNVMTATTSQRLVFEKGEVDEKLKGKSPLGDYLVDRWESYERWWTKADPEKLRWTMWDVAIVEALIKPELSKVEEFDAPEENVPRKIGIHTAIDVEGMKQDFWSFF